MRTMDRLLRFPCYFGCTFFPSGFTFDSELYSKVTSHSVGFVKAAFALIGYS